MEVLRQQPPLERNHYMGYHSLSHFDSFGPDRLYSKFPSLPKAPPTPPQTMNRPSLPSIADILNPSNDDDHSSARQGRYNNARQVDSQPTQQIQQPPAQCLPPTPPLSTGSTQDRNGQHLPLLQPSHVSRISSPVFNRESNHQRGYNSTADARPHVNTQPNVLRSPEIQTPNPNSTPIHHSSHPYRRSPELRYGRRSQSPRESDRSAQVNDKRPSLPLPNGSRSPRTSIKEEHATSRYERDVQRHQSSAPHEKLSTILNSTPSPYLGVSPHRSLPPDFQGSAQVHGISSQHSPPHYSPHTSPRRQRSPVMFYRPRSESWTERPPHQQPHQQPQHLPHQVQVSPRLSHTNQPLSQVLSSQPVGASDRYICSTCGKCFSRPSSLRIHSHSHTGEKPFRCSREGCGKAFSVRSNMKRHERGCHVGIIPTNVGYPSGLVGPAPAGMMPQAKTEHLGLGVTGLPSMASGMPPMPRELAPALDG